MSSVVSERKKSSTSGKLRRGSSKRSRRNSKSGQSQKSLDFSSRDISAIEEDETRPIKPINYREELTFLFFNSMLEEKTVESRQILPTQNVYDTGISKSCMNTTFEKDFKNIQEIDLKKYSVVSVEASKLILEKIQHKTQSTLLNQNESSVLTSHQSSSTLSKKDKSSKRSSIRRASINISEGSKKSSRRGTIQTASNIKEGFEWAVTVEDKTEEIIFKNGNRYNGDTSRGLMHGKGIFYWEDGTVYEGYFKDGYPHGLGQVILPDLSIYEGDFFSGYFHGTGVLRITNTPGIYSGSWKHGKKHGKGWLLWEAQNWYDGEWFADEMHGFGYRRYKNGARYKGMWSKNKKNGEGSMIWENNDYYVGDWMDNRPHGYGEYTWNLYFSRSFIFPYYNWYKGSWVEGERTGAGIMDFGTNSGAKLAGIWVNNQKHGPGIMVCGNGMTLQRNPLFTNDKPVHMNASKHPSVVENAEEESKPPSSVLLSEISALQSKSYDESEEKIVSEKDSYKEILKEINSKVALKAFDSDILTNITKSGLNISASKFVKLTNEEMPDIGNKWCPLEIPIHTVAEEVDLNYYIDTVTDYWFEHSQKDLPCKKFEYLSTDISPKNELTDQISTSENDKEYVKNNEERLLRHLITAYLPHLTELYYQYATLAKNGEISVKPMLVRLFLWQLLRDIGLPHQGVPLVESDLFLANNPSSCVESDHCPFEPIYFWQFLQSLLGCSWLLFLSREQKFDSLTNGIIAQIFKQFLEYDVFPNAGRFEGFALTEYRDLLPIKAIYNLYLKVGEPHSVRDFLYHTYAKRGKNPPCYAAIKDENKNKNVTKGTNAVMLGHKVMYMNVKEYITPAASIQYDNPDMFSKSLYTFRSLGRKKIIRCVIKVCPKIFSSDGTIDVEYKLIFLEFYEIVLQCAYEKAERKRKAEEKLKQEEYLQFLKDSQPPADEKPGKKKQKK